MTYADLATELRRLGLSVPNPRAHTPEHAGELTNAALGLPAFMNEIFSAHVQQSLVTEPHKERITVARAAKCIYDYITFVVPDNVMWLPEDPPEERAAYTAIAALCARRPEWLIEHLIDCMVGVADR